GCRDLEQRPLDVRREQDEIPPAPRSAPACGCRAQRLGPAALDRGLLQESAREETDLATIRRPERVEGPVGTGQGPRFELVEATQPEAAHPRGVLGGVDYAAAVGRDGRIGIAREATPARNRDGEPERRGLGIGMPEEARAVPHRPDDEGENGGGAQPPRTAPRCDRLSRTG